MDDVSRPVEPAMDPEGDEPGLTPAERVYAWNPFEVLGFATGNSGDGQAAFPQVPEEPARGGQARAQHRHEAVLIAGVLRAAGVGGGR